MAKNRGWPVLIRFSDNNEEMVVRSSEELAALSGRQFKILERNYKPNVGNASHVTVPDGVPMQDNVWVKRVHAMRVKSVVHSDDGTEVYLYLAGFPEQPVTVTREFWDKRRPKNPKMKYYLVDHRNGYYTLTPMHFQHQNFTKEDTSSPRPETPKPDPETEPPKGDDTQVPDHVTQYKTLTGATPVDFFMPHISLGQNTITRDELFDAMLREYGTEQLYGEIVMLDHGDRVDLLKRRMETFLDELRERERVAQEEPAHEEGQASPENEEITEDGASAS